MPSLYSRQHSITAEVVPLLLPAGTGSSSKLDGQIAKASSSLWTRLGQASCNDDDQEHKTVAIAVEWPEDRRLGKGKARSLIVWVQKAVEDHRQLLTGSNDDQLRLQVPPGLLPPFCVTPLAVTLRPYQPFELTLVVLQPVRNAGEAPVDTGDSEDKLDFTSLYHSLTRPHHDAEVNGTSTSSHQRSPALILRHGDIIPIPVISASAPNPFTRRFKLSLLEPVVQGFLTSSTRVILSMTPFVLENKDLMDGEIGDHLSESSHAKTNLSLSTFDPDAFLSTSLSLNFRSSDDVPDGDPLGDDVDMAQSLSSNTSGSLTPRPGGRPASPPAQMDDFLLDGEPERGPRFTPVRAAGPAHQGSGSVERVCWMGVGGLGRAGIFEGDWVLLKTMEDAERNGGNGRLVKALAWERLDGPDEDLPTNPILLPAPLYRSLFPSPRDAATIIVAPTPFGARLPRLPTARTITLARIATAEGHDKRYERSWLKGLRSYFSCDGEDDQRLVRRGDVISVPVWLAQPLPSDTIYEEEDDESDNDMDPFGLAPSVQSTAVVYFTITSLSFDPLVPIEEDFRSSLSSKARAGELGCWIDVGEKGITKMVLTGVEQARIGSRDGDLAWHGIAGSPEPYSLSASSKLGDLLRSCFAQAAMAYAIQLSILIKGARGSGKRSMIRSLANKIGYNVIDVECYDIVGDTPAVTSGSLLARLDKAVACSPSLLVLHHIQALAKKSESTASGRAPPIIKVLEEITEGARVASMTGWPIVLLATAEEGDSLPNELAGYFKQEITMSAPNEAERLSIIRHALQSTMIAPDVALTYIARQTAALHAGDISALLHRARDLSHKRIASGEATLLSSASLAGLPVSSADLNAAIGEARAAYSDSIGAPKIPNVGWDDVGGLASVKQDILDTIQLPLDRPDMFGEGLKKRSGILLYGPPGTGKTLLAKAVATSCSLNFLSVKGPELLNMYIGESEANVRRLFQRARDASPCVIFMDELDSVAPKRGNQGDSGGVMDRIVSQLLAELDGMSSTSSTGGQVFILGATNRPDLLDPALLRPGRFDKMLYLSVPTTHGAQLSILQALTRKFDLDAQLDLAAVAERCPFNYTGADLYALCADAMLGAMTRCASAVDDKITRLNEETRGHERQWVGDLTPQLYLSKMATEEEVKVRVTQEDFEQALERLVPSVSGEEMAHYERVQREFKGFSIGNKGDDDRDGQAEAASSQQPNGKIGPSANNHNGLAGGAIPPDLFIDEEIRQDGHGTSPTNLSESMVWKGNGKGKGKTKGKGQAVAAVNGDDVD
ncbi:hypothetical protein IAU60_004832 [Kwoniella sp. DSM 27419]